MAKTYNPEILAKFCEALGVERVNEVSRVVLDIRSGWVPQLLVERFADSDRIEAALAGPAIEVNFVSPATGVERRPVECLLADAHDPHTFEVSFAGRPGMRTYHCNGDGTVPVDVSTMDGKG